MRLYFNVYTKITQADWNEHTRLPQWLKWSIMVVPLKPYCILLLGFLILSAVMDKGESTSCDEDEDCKSYQVCCGERCTSWPKCFLNSDKECYYDTHCVRGKTCRNNVCVRNKVEMGSRCENNRDCTVDIQNGRIAGRKLCCIGKCLPATNCTVLLKINSNGTTQTTGSSLSKSCAETANCPTGLECRNRVCTAPDKTDMVSRSKKPAESNDSEDTRENMSTGLLSAALFSGAVLLTFACFCILKETKYYRRICFDQNHLRSSQTLPACSVQHCNETVVTNHSTCQGQANGSQHPVTHILFPGLFGERQFQANDRSVTDNQYNLNPPDYRSVCQSDFPPPTYDEAVNQYKLL